MVLSVLFLQCASLLFLSILPQRACAEEEGITITPQVSIDGSGESITFDRSTQPLAKYIEKIYNYAMGIVGILATIVMMYGGFNWIMAGGNAERIADAKSWVVSSIAGLVLVLATYLLLSWVSPKLVNFDPIQLESTQVKSVRKCSMIMQINTGTNRCPSGYDESSDWKRDCNYDPSKDFGVCCCALVTASKDGWAFDGGIEAQLASDASSELKDLLSCLRNNLDPGIGRISSISDSAGLATCQTSYNSDICDHAKNSCHYGGGTGNGSMAVDFGDVEDNYSQYLSAITACEGLVNYYAVETNKKGGGKHLHISTAGCTHN